MSSNDKHDQGQPSRQGVSMTKEQYDKDQEGLTEKILKQLENRKLLDKFKIIIIVGHAGAGKSSLVKLITGAKVPVEHTLAAGTAIPTIIPAHINGELILFIDSPGFGHATSKEGVIKTQIHSLLGYFTRAIGGVHGILYVQDITMVRTMLGMREATEFLDELADEAIRPNITFITTKWDSVAEKLLPRCESREEELKNITWKTFKLGTSGGSRYFRHGIDCDVDSQQEQTIGQNRLLSDVMKYYSNVSAESLRMPFTESKYYKQGVEIATVAGKVIVLGVATGAILGLVALGVLAIADGIASGAITFFVEFGYI